MKIKELIYKNEYWNKINLININNTIYKKIFGKKNFNWNEIIDNIIFNNSEVKSYYFINFSHLFIKI